MKWIKLHLKNGIEIWVNGCRIASLLTSLDGNGTVVSSELSATEDYDLLVRESTEDILKQLSV